MTQQESEDRTPGLIRPRWPAADRIRAVSTERRGGVSPAPWRSLNLGSHVGDRQAHVAANRARLARAVGLPSPPCWLDQVHGTQVVSEPAAGQPVTADAAVTRLPGRVLAILTADCLPVLLCSRAGEVVGAAHAGWRGLADGVLERTVLAMATAPDDLLAWLGPAIGQAAFEVGPEVREAFAARDPGSAECFRAGNGDRWHADLVGLARRRLLGAGLAPTHIFTSGDCTFADPRRFFSYRRDGACGRMATLIWIERQQSSGTHQRPHRPLP